MIERHGVAEGGAPEAELLNTPDADAIRQETGLLIRRYGGEALPADLRAMARVFDAAAPSFGLGAARLRLWARALQIEASLKEAEGAAERRDP